jgi:hypothetical protein
MNPIIAVSVLIYFALGVCLWLLVRSARLAAGKLPVTSDWLDDLSIKRYRPMLRLLAAEDLPFVTKQTGFSSLIAARLRAQRCLIVRSRRRL